MHFRFMLHRHYHISMTRDKISIYILLEAFKINLFNFSELKHTCIFDHSA